MAVVDLYNMKGEKVGTQELKDDIFNIEPNFDVMWRYVDYQLSLRRAGTVSTKTRSEVSGGGRKPWIQKHTGRARHGSIRSPIWRHGGVAHGPKPRDWSKKLPKKMKKLALKSALSQRFKEGNIIVVDDIGFDSSKTKNMRQLIKAFGFEGKKILFVLPWKRSEYENVKLSCKNIPGLKAIIADNPGATRENESVMRIDGLNVFDILNHEKLVLTRDMVMKIEEVLG
ncbi:MULTISPECIES: 50S ribosomal protein L4 [Pseudothermotoga]|jgi:large subunit ribosomal protein L4|uniref:50S ribosomal protein L4 n=1 Tax=Pseudothermotoga TaxID=1643951 RepID=UPI0007472C3D|nr:MULTISPECIES: 50S ribosomal protein L4 [Pseudothermotoga]KUK21637.1 MAG: 50S ribosomal protein L4 [Pseudothermotoga lettingae]MDI3494413.1 large subunit ribosomal protein [Pseudothermotoga sp.]HBJ82189.1 50S ribosomal protein L4 [Pseudothermotoga sp.]HBT26392.1 50S ribosomal protein L4 [Pseudothermotoga sp.]